MFLTVHATVGAVLGKATPNPWVAFILGFISHFIVDMIPHGNESVLVSGVTQKDRVRRLLMVVAIDGALVLALLAWWLFVLKVVNPWSVLAGVIGGVLPDALQAPNHLFSKKYLLRYERIHQIFHLHYFTIFKSTLISFTAGFVIQLITLGVFLYFVGH